MPNCECGRPVYIKKTGECSACYQRRWRRNNPGKQTEYARRFMADPENAERVKSARRARYAAAAATRREARRDTRPVDVVLLDYAEQAFATRERKLARRKAENERYAEKRRAYQATYVDANKAQRQRRYADQREAETGYRSHPSSRRALTPEQKACKREYMRRWNDENRERIRTQNRERQREYRRAAGVEPVVKAPPCACGNPHEAKGMCKACYMRRYRAARKSGNAAQEREKQ